MRNRRAKEKFPWDSYIYRLRPVRGVSRQQPTRWIPPVTQRIALLFSSRYLLSSPSYRNLKFAPFCLLAHAQPRNVGGWYGAKVNDIYRRRDLIPAPGLETLEQTSGLLDSPGK